MFDFRKISISGDDRDALFNASHFAFLSFCALCLYMVASWEKHLSTKEFDEVSLELRNSANFEEAFYRSIDSYRSSDYYETVRMMIVAVALLMIEIVVRIFKRISTFALFRTDAIDTEKIDYTRNVRVFLEHACDFFQRLIVMCKKEVVFSVSLLLVFLLIKFVLVNALRCMELLH